MVVLPTLLTRPAALNSHLEKAGAEAQRGGAISHQDQGVGTPANCTLGSRRYSVVLAEGHLVCAHVYCYAANDACSDLHDTPE